MMTRQPCEPAAGLASRTHVILNPPQITATDFRIAYTQLAADDRIPKSKSSISREHVEDDEIDELAGTSLVNVPVQPFTLPSTKRESRLLTHFPSEAVAEFRSTNAEPLPSKPPSTGTQTSATKMKVLKLKSANQKVISKTTNAPPKRNIPSPMLTSSSNPPIAGTVAGGHPSLNDLDKRVSHLTRQADAYERETRVKEKLWTAVEASSRPSPLQRGRSVLMTAKHAITRRLGSPNVKLNRLLTPLSRKSSRPPAVSVNEVSEPVSVAPKPLPVYESMRSRRETPEPQDDDPFSDNMEMDEAWSDFNLDFDRQKDPGMAARYGSCSRTSSANKTDKPAGEDLLVQPQSIMSFSNKVSGLKQHPDPDFFSSSPVGFSTPRVRLKPTAGANGQKRLSTVPMGNSLSPEVNSERNTTDDEDDLLSRSEVYAGLASNMKRKSATEDLHTQMSKRAKTNPGVSGETAELTQGFVRLGTNHGQSMQNFERITGDVQSPTNLPQDKGFGIFALSNGKEAETSAQNSVENLDVRRHSRRYSSSASRPASVLFSRESRAKVPLLDSYKEDQMDIDELQMDDFNGRR
ncbi:MAG: hypothetical protein Q9169_000312 [Polycauliona sp. 2 TL-2023]